MNTLMGPIMRLPKVRPQISICLKCKHRIKSYPFFPRGQ